LRLDSVARHNLNQKLKVEDKPAQKLVTKTRARTRKPVRNKRWPSTAGCHLRVGIQKFYQLRSRTVYCR
jgi:hypothetical protein